MSQLHDDIEAEGWERVSRWCPSCLGPEWVRAWSLRFSFGMEFTEVSAIISYFVCLVSDATFGKQLWRLKLAVHFPDVWRTCHSLNTAIISQFLGMPHWQRRYDVVLKFSVKLRHEQTSCNTLRGMQHASVCRCQVHVGKWSFHIAISTQGVFIQVLYTWCPVSPWKFAHYTPTSFL